MISIFPGKTSSGVGDLYPRVSSVGEHVSNKEFGIAGVKFAAPNVNNYGKVFGGRLLQNDRQFAAVGFIPYFHSGRSEMQLKANETVTAFPVPDFIDRGIL